MDDAFLELTTTYSVALRRYLAVIQYMLIVSGMGARMDLVSFNEYLEGLAFIYSHLLFPNVKEVISKKREVSVWLDAYAQWALNHRGRRQ